MTGVTTHTAETVFFGRTYGEAFGLLLEARDYFAFLEPDERGMVPPRRRLQMCSETMRLTARLTQIMAWLLAQRAVFEGEMPRALAASEEFRLTADSVCMADTDSNATVLPSRLRELLDQSRRLYVRVARLDELNRRAAAQGA